MRPDTAKLYFDAIRSAVEMKFKGTPSKRGAVPAPDRDVAFEWLAFLL
jgi:hypothetical protein